MKFLVIVILFFSCQTKKYNELSAGKSLVKNDINFWEDSIRHVAGSNSIPHSLSLLDIQTNKRVNFKAIASRGVIFFYFNNIHCDACIHQELNCVSKIKKYKNIILLAEGTTRRNLRIYLRSIGINEQIPCYLIEGDIKNVLRSITVPTMFRVTDDLMPYGIHFSRLGVEDSTMNYINLLIN